MNGFLQTASAVVVLATVACQRQTADRTRKAVPRSTARLFQVKELIKAASVPAPQHAALPAMLPEG